MSATRLRMRPTVGIIALGLAGLTIASGWALAAGHARALFVASAILGLLSVAAAERGAFVSLLLIAAMNGVPFVDTSHIVSAKLTVADIAIIALCVTATLWLLIDRRGHDPRGRIGRSLSRAAIPLFLWWLFTLSRGIVAHVSILHAAAFGRDFLYFALLLLVLPRVRLTTRDIRLILGGIGAAASIFAVGQIATATGLGHPGTLIHFQYTVQQSGLTRVYANMTDMVTAVLSGVVTACLLAPAKSRLRAIATPVSLLLLVSVAVQLTRARWLGLVFGLLIVGIWIAFRGDVRVSKLMRKRLLLGAGALGFVGVAALVTSPGVLSGGTLFQRLLSIITDLQSNGGTVAVRQAAAHTAIAYLGNKWPIGVGLIPPSSHYFVGLPEGSLRDTDLGVLGAIMTIGLVGAILIYAPVVICLRHCLRRSNTSQAEYYWLRYGGAIWIVATLFSSFTLVTLFSASGLALTAVMLTVLVHPSVSGAGVSAVPAPSSQTSRVYSAIRRIEFEAPTRPRRQDTEFGIIAKEEAARRAQPSPGPPWRVPPAANSRRSPGGPPPVRS